MNEIFEKTSWLEVVVEKLAESSAPPLRESDRVVADRRRWAIIVWMSNLLSVKEEGEIGFGSLFTYLVLVFDST